MQQKNKLKYVHIFQEYTGGLVESRDTREKRNDN